MEHYPEHLPKFSPYPRPKHPNPLTAQQVEVDLAKLNVQDKRATYHLWDGEVAIEVIVGTCVYGFPSCVLVEFSIGSGVKSYNWNSYGLNHGELNHTKDFQAMFEWIATKITERATGSQMAVGSFSDITVAFK